MRLLLFCIYDSATGAFMRPFAAQAKQQAIRAFADQVNDPQTPVHAHPEDYALFHVGVFDPQDGSLIPEDPPMRLALAIECVEKDAPPMEIS